MPHNSLSYASPDDHWTKKALIGSIEYLTGKPRLQRMYKEVLSSEPFTHHIWETLLQKLGIKSEMNEARLQSIPSKGPVIFIANHPFGVVDGLMLGNIISMVRNDFKLIVNEVLCREPLLNPYLLPISFEDTKAALQTNIKTRKTAMSFLREGQSIGIFPAGGVSTASKFWKPADDLEWKRFLVKLIKNTKATVIPIYFYGQNSKLFQLASQINMNIRYGLLLNEVRNKIGKSFKIEIGFPIRYKDLDSISHPDMMLDFLRSQVYGLKNAA
ncbi:MAG TPA: lysophospholipid acyltransferase family protein [Cyclobacteriaceae bacterium]